MKVLKKYTITTVFKIGLLTACLAGFMLMGVDLFKNLDTYTNYHVPALYVLKITLLYFPEAFLLGLGPSFLFAITYFLSQFHASNEYICVLNSGIRYGKFLRPCIITGVVVSILFFTINEFVALPCSNEKESLFKNITYEIDNLNNSNIALSDFDNGYLVYATDYIDSSETLYDVNILVKNSEGKLISRTNAYKASWNNALGCWTLYDAYTYYPSIDNKDTNIVYNNTFDDISFVLQPELFKNMSSEISKMSIDLALEYLNKIKVINPVQYSSSATEFYKRVLSCLTPLIMIVISCCLNYNFKKNVMFFSLICSICIAVVYYVIQMMTIMLADQGIILPALGMIIPFICIVVLTSLLALVLRK